MLRFYMPSSSEAKEKRIKELNSQFDEFINSYELREYLKVLDIYSSTLEGILRDLDRYEERKTESGRIVEAQNAPLNKVLEEKRHLLYPFYGKLGLLNINKPNLDDYNHIVLLGGTANSNFDKTECAKQHLNNNVKDVSALACFRPIPLKERDVAYNNYGQMDFETEVGSFVSAFSHFFDVREEKEQAIEWFERNINKCFSRRAFYNESEIVFRVFASPSLSSDGRAGTYDTCEDYVKTLNNDNDCKILVITNNQYCNYQFVPFARAILKSDKEGIDMDIIGCTDDNSITSADDYNTGMYCGDIKNMIREIIFFREELGVRL